jgi:hypothetical protein
VKKYPLVCLGTVRCIWRKWITQVGPRGKSRGHWSYWCKVMVMGKIRKCLITRAFFADLESRGTKRLLDEDPFYRSEAVLHPSRKDCWQGKVQGRVQ